ncbi:MAG: hypothetical protein LBI69_00195, partial [Puniceicoccales bacterium]|nr:hypothetical protein [Puniceicoccales bacterium]
MSIFLPSSISGSTPPAMNSTADDDEAAKNFKILYAENKESAIATFMAMLDDPSETESNGAVKIFLQLYADNKDDALNFLYDKALPWTAKGKLLENHSMSENMAVEISKKLYEDRNKNVLYALTNISKTDKFTNKAFAIFLALYENNKNGAVDFLCNRYLPHRTIGNLLANSSMGENMAVEIFNNLFAIKPEKAIDTFDYMLMTNEYSDRAFAIFLIRYENSEDDAVKLLCNEKLKRKAIGKLLANHSMDESNAMEILRKLYVENSGKAASAFSYIIMNNQLSDRAFAIFLVLYENNKDDAVKLLCKEELTREAIGELLANHSMDESSAVEILRELYVENSGKAASAFRHMITNKQLSNRAAAIFLI